MRSIPRTASANVMTAGHLLSLLTGIAVAVCAASACGVCVCLADEAVPAETAGDSGGLRGSSVIVLKDGTVFEGDVTTVAGGYRVRQPAGAFIIPFDTVLLTAPDLRAAYNKLAANQQQPTYHTRVQLAKWCADNGLFDEARREIAAAIRLEPQRREARELLKEIEQKTNPTPQHLTPPVPAARTDDGFVPSRAVSAAGVSPELMQEFIRRVQPLMVNKCGNASCHGPASGNAFTIDIVRSGRRNQRSHSVRNLTAALRQIDAARPELSPLLLRPAGLADTVHQTVFAGPRGQRQLAILRNWINGVAGASEQVVAVPPTSTPSPSSATMTANGERASTGVVTAGFEAPVGMQNPPAELPASDDALLDRVLLEERADPFDPDLFNRKVHGFSVFAAPEESGREAADD